MLNRSPPVMVDLRCPHCDKLWMRFVAAGSSDEAQISCRCNRLINYRVVGAQVVVSATASAR